MSAFFVCGIIIYSLAGAFKARDIQLWQIIFSKKDIKERYEAPR